MPQKTRNIHRENRLATGRRPARAGLTLLELLLALALSVLVMAAVGTAISLHLNSLNMGRAQVEEAQLARAVLQKISNDLRGTIYYEPLDPPLLEGSTDGASAEAPQGSTEGDPTADSALSEIASDSETAVQEDAVQESDEPLTDIAASTAVMSQPGLIGNQYTLQIDVARPPRVDQYQAMVSSALTGELADIPSDVKTVAYYVRQQADPYSNNTGAASLGGNKGSFLEYSGGIGLMRRELDYSVTRWASENGQTDSLDQSSRLLAPEIQYIEFRYFDGSEWLLEWNSEELGGLPKAVEVVILIQSPKKGKQPENASTSLITGLQTNGREYVYRKVVQLPLSRAPSDEGEEELEELGL